MADFKAGSVTAEIILDTTKFNEAIGKLKEQVASLKGEFQSVKGVSKFTEQIEQLKKEMDSLKTANEDYRKQLKKVREENDKLTKSYDKLKNSNKNATDGVIKANEGVVKSITKETEAVTKLNEEQRKAGLEAKRNARIYDKMRFVAAEYITGLKRGKRSVGVEGTDTALWDNFEGLEGRFRTFDFDRFADHLRKSFEGVIPKDVFDSMFSELTKQYNIGLRGWIEDRGGIPERKLEDLILAADVVKGKEKRRKRSKLDEYLGIDSNALIDSNIEKAAKQLIELQRQLNTTSVDLEKLGQKNEFLEGFKKDIDTVLNAIRKFAPEFTRVSETGTSEIKKFIEGWKNTSFEFKRTSTEIKEAMERTFQINTLDKAQSRYNEFLVGFNKLTQSIVRTTEVLKTFNFALLEGVEKESIFYQRTVSLASAMQRMNSQGTENWKGRGQFGYSQYVSQINQITEAIEKQRLKTVNLASAQYRLSQIYNGTDINLNTYKANLSQITAEIEKQRQKAASLSKAQQDLYIKYKTSGINLNTYKANLTQITAEIEKQRLKTVNLASAQYKLAQAYRSTGINLNTYKANINQINEKLNQQTQRTAKLSKAQLDLWHKYHRIDRGSYISNMNEINAKLKEQTTNTEKATTNTQKLGKGMTSTAHSGRILSNTLYQIRGALLSLKMIFTAMGGMMLWGFAMDIAEGVKQTVTAKNEMEAQLNQAFTDKETGIIDTAGIKYFRKELDKLPQTFKKVNKYHVGETASSIGLEFDLTAKEMADALPIITMVSSEYVRAGRKEEEAALAVKDILQGEFQRLSRETGIGKEELIAFGWDENKENIDGLLKALNKAALARHWDTFAKKATSLNDVLTITKSRFSEFSADVIDSITPAIVTGFNMIIDTIETLQNAFNGLGSFWQNFTMMGGGSLALGGILTALPMLIKGMGAVDIATIGWKKSLITTALNLDKTTVASQGLGKALAEVITGTKAAEMGEMRWSKAIMGRLLGVDQAVLKEKGYLSSMIASRAALKGSTDAELLAGATSLTRSQKLLVLTKNVDVATAKEYSRGKALLKTATSWKVLRVAILGVMSIAAISWLSSIAMWCDTIKKKVDSFNEILETGQDRYNGAKKTVEEYTKKIDELTQSGENYDKSKEKELRNARQIAIANRKDIYNAKELVKLYDKRNKEIQTSNDLSLQSVRNRIYEEQGLNIEKEGHWKRQVEQAQKYLVKAEQERKQFEYASLQHINERVNIMRAAGVEEEKRIDYITEYSTKAEEAAKHLKEFNQGDFTAGIYFLLDQVSLMWIDLWNDQHFLNFWKSVQDTWENIKPTLYAIKDALGDLGHMLLDFFSTKEGQIIGGIALFGTVIGGLGIKFYHVLGGAKSTIDILKTLGGKVKNVGKGWKDAGDKAEDAVEKMGGTKSTGGITGDTGGVSKTPFKETLKSDVQNYARAAVGIAAVMGLITEAIILMKAPMGALANVGQQFKAQEPQIRAGIDGLKLIAPVMAILLPPVVALTVIMGKFDSVLSTSTIVKGAGKAAIGIAAGMLLIAEAIALVVPSIWALAAVGSQYMNAETQVKRGAEAMKIVADSLNYLKPFIPMLVIAIGSIALLFTGGGAIVGGIAIVSITAGIAVGMLWVAEAIRSLQYPLSQIAELGSQFSDLSNVRQGAEAMKLTAEALGYVESAMADLALIKWETLASYVADLIGVKIGADLSDLTGEGGFFDQLSTFTKQFNQITIEAIDTSKVTTLSESATGIDSVKTALNTVKDALKDLPNFEVDNRSTNEKYQDAVSGATTTEGISNYFEQLKQPIEQLNEFITNFNDNIQVVPIDTEKISVISDSANGIATINSAIENVKTAMGNAVDAQWNANVSTSGIMGAAVGLLLGDGNPSGSGLKAGLDELYNSCKDIMDFNTKIAGLTTTNGGDTSGVADASNMVSALQTQINNLKTTLQGAVPTVKTAANGVGTAIVEGVKSGISTLSTSVSAAFDPVVTTISTYGTKASDGFKNNFKIKDVVSTEISNALTAFEGKADEFYNKGKELGSAFQRGFKDGAGINSPGYAAQAMQSEIGYIGEYIQGGIDSLPAKALEFATLLSSNMKFDLGLGALQLPDMTQFQTQLGGLIPVVDNVKTQVSTNFNTMKSNVGLALTGISTDATTKYNQIVGTTRTSLTNMQGQTTKNISAIRTSWKGMQTALIASAENIRQQTGSKINNLKTNMADFWKKIQNPSLLISGAAGGDSRGTIRRRYGGSNRIRSGLYAGGTNSPSKMPNISKDIKEYLECLMTSGTNCYAGGWNFNWNSSVQRKFNGWNTHFGKYKIDDYVKVGKFYNNSFPVKGIAEIAKQYIYDTIAATRYDKYYNSHFGEDPLAALRAGAFNCWDGTNIVLALARAFGFEGSRGSGTWNGIGHVWAEIPGLGVIDPTAIQGGYGFKSPKVRGYSAGGTISRNSSGGDLPTGETNYNTHIEINVHGDDVSVNDKQIDDNTGRKIIDLLGINPSTGR